MQCGGLLELQRADVTRARTPPARPGKAASYEVEALFYEQFSVSFWGFRDGVGVWGGMTPPPKRRRRRRRPQARSLCARLSLPFCPTALFACFKTMNSTSRTSTGEYIQDLMGGGLCDPVCVQHVAPGAAARGSVRADRAGVLVCRARAGQRHDLYDAPPRARTVARRPGACLLLTGRGLAHESRSLTIARVLALVHALALQFSPPRPPPASACTPYSLPRLRYARVEQEELLLGLRSVARLHAYFWGHDKADEARPHTSPAALCARARARAALDQG